MSDGLITLYVYELAKCVSDTLYSGNMCHSRLALVGIVMTYPSKFLILEKLEMMRHRLFVCSRFVIRARGLHDLN